MADEYQRSDEGGPYRLLGLRNRNQAFNPQTRPNLYYPLYVDPGTGRVPPPVQTSSRWRSVRMLRTARRLAGPGRDRVSADNALLVAERSGAEWRVSRKDYLYGADGAVAKTLVKSMWLEAEFSNDYGRKAVKDLFGEAIMDFPKSPQFMKRIIDIAAGQRQPHPRLLCWQFIHGARGDAGQRGGRGPLPLRDGSA